MSKRKTPKQAEEPPISPPAAKPRRADRHKARHMMNVPDPHYAILQQLAERYGRPVSWQLRMILEAAFRAEGLWPPPQA